MSHQPTTHGGDTPNEDRLDELLAEYIQAAEAGHPPEAEAFLDRHPEFAEELREFLDDRAAFEQMAELFRPATAVSGRLELSVTPDATPTDAGSSRAGDGPEQATRVRRFGDYELLGEVARGGMGVVYKAKQRRADRVVALKMILAGHLASADDVRRFQVEAENAARLDHPNIVPVYEVGRHRGRHYFTMKLVEGGSLVGRGASYAADSTAAARLVASAARAVHYAHQRGILHRDLKPGNILLDGAGQPLVTDFGLAQRLGDGERTGLTLSGALMGSPKYMSPEQARGDRGLTVATDVWGLGAVMYELLTGRAPFDGDTAVAVLEKVKDQDPPRPAGINPRVPRDLEVICLKCLEKDPKRRYASADAMARDLDRWLAGEPITARSAGRAERTWQWCRRKPAAAALAAVSAVAGVLLIAMGVYTVVRVDAARMAAEATSATARRARHDAEGARTDAEHAWARSLVSEGDALLAAGSGAEAVHRYTRAGELCAKLGMPCDAAELGLWDAYRRCPPPLFSVEPEGGSTVIAFCPDSRTLLYGSYRTVMARDAITGRVLRRLEGHTGTVLALSVSPDGRRALSGSDDKTVRLWDLVNGTTLRVLRGHEGEVRAVAFTPDGGTAATADHGGGLLLWSLGPAASDAPVRAGRLLNPPDEAGPLMGMRLSPDGRYVLAYGQRPCLHLWDLAEWRRVRDPWGGGYGEVASAAFVPAGPRAAVAMPGGVVTLWDFLQWAPTRSFHGHRGPVSGVTVSADGGHLLSAGSDGTVRLWEVDGGRQVRGFATPGSGWPAVALSLDGRFAAATGDRLDVWDLRAPSPEARVLRPGRPHSNDSSTLGGLPVSTDGALALCPGGEGVVELVDVATGQPLVNYDAWVSAAEFSPGGGSFVAGNQTDALRPFDLATGRPTGQRPPFAGWPVGLWFADGGRTCVWAASDGKFGVCDTDTWRTVRTFGGHDQPTTGAAVSRDGRVAASGDETGVVKFWSVATGAKHAQPLRHAEHVAVVALSPDGTLALTGGRDRTARLWNVATGAPLHLLSGHLHELSAVAFREDGQVAATGSLDGLVKLWDVATGRELRTLDGHQGTIQALRFMPQGKSLLSLDQTGMLIHWDFSPSRVSGYGDFAGRLKRVYTNQAAAPPGSPLPTADLVTLSEWCVFRGEFDLAADLLEQARSGGAEVSPLMLARCQWKAGNPAAAAREFRRAKALSKTPSPYLDLCVAAAARDAEAARKPTSLPASRPAAIGTHPG